MSRWLTVFVVVAVVCSQPSIAVALTPNTPSDSAETASSDSEDADWGNLGNQSARKRPPRTVYQTLDGSLGEADDTDASASRGANLSSSASLPNQSPTRQSAREVIVETNRTYRQLHEDFLTASYWRKLAEGELENAARELFVPDLTGVTIDTLGKILERLGTKAHGAILLDVIPSVVFYVTAEIYRAKARIIQESEPERLREKLRALEQNALKIESETDVTGDGEYTVADRRKLYTERRELILEARRSLVAFEGRAFRNRQAPLVPFGENQIEGQSYGNTRGLIEQVRFLLWRDYVVTNSWLKNRPARDSLGRASRLSFPRRTVESSIVFGSVRTGTLTASDDYVLYRFEIREEQAGEKRYFYLNIGASESKLNLYLRKNDIPSLSDPESEYEPEPGTVGQFVLTEDSGLEPGDTFYLLISANTSGSYAVKGAGTKKNTIPAQLFGSGEPVSGTVVDEWSSNPYPDPSIQSVETTTTDSGATKVSVTVRNTGGKADWQSIALSLPTISDANRVSVVDSSFTESPTVYPPGSTVGSRYGFANVTLDGTLVEGFADDWANGETRTIVIRIDGKVSESVPVLVKSVAKSNGTWQYAPDPTGDSVVLDEQSEYAVKYVIEGTNTERVTAETPEDGATGLSSEVQLQWSGREGLTYDVYLEAGDENPTRKVADDLTDSEYTVSVSSGTTYYWRVVASDGSFEYETEVRSFTTEQSVTGPGPLVDGPETALATVPQSFTVTTSDSEGPEVYYEFRWGDGSTTRFPKSGTVRQSVEATVNHVWGEAGTYTVEVRAVTTDGTPTAWTERTVRVTEPTPSEDVYAGSRIGVIVDTSEDPPYHTRTVGRYELRAVGFSQRGVTFDIYRGGTRIAEDVLFTSGQRRTFDDGRLSLFVTNADLLGTGNATLFYYTTVRTDPSVVTLEPEQLTVSRGGQVSFNLSIPGVDPDQGVCDPEAFVTGSAAKWVTESPDWIEFTDTAFDGDYQSIEADCEEVADGSITVRLAVPADTAVGSYSFDLLLNNGKDEAYRVDDTEVVVEPQNEPPTEPTLDTPANGTSGVGRESVLRWSATDPDGDDLRYKVYLEGGDRTPDELVRTTEMDELSPNLDSGTTYYWRVVVIDSDGATNASRVWSFTTAPSGPTAAFSSDPSTPMAGEPVEFDASQSRALGGNITAFEWDFDGDGETDANGRQPTHVFEEPGTYSVRLTVVGEEASNTTTRSVSVSADTQSPVIRRFDAERSRNSTVVVTIRTNERLENISVSVGRAGVIGEAAFTENGSGPYLYTTTFETRPNTTYTFTLQTASDRGGNDGATGQTASVTVPPSNEPPNLFVETNETAVVEGEAVALSAARTTDPDGDRLRFEWRQMGGPEGRLATRGPEATFFAPSVEENQTVLLNVTVTDEAGATRSWPVVLRVLDSEAVGNTTETTPDNTTDDNTTETTPDNTTDDNTTETTPDNTTETTPDNTTDDSTTLLEIVADNDASITYRIVVDGDVEKTRVTEKIKAEGNDEITERDDGTVVIEGFTGNEGYGDSYEITGEVVDFERVSGDASITIRLDGDPVAPSDLSENDDGDTPTDDSTTLLEIVADNDASITYRIVVDGDAEKTRVTEKIKAEGNDEITERDDGTVVIEGFTGNEGYGDSFEITGEIVSFERVSGDASITVRLDGDPVDPSDLGEDSDGDTPPDTPDTPESDSPQTFEIVATNDASITYRVVVCGDAEKTRVTEKIKAEGNDEITERDDGTVVIEGFTGNEGYGDSFEITGEIVSFERVSGDAEIRLELDGDPVSPDDLRDGSCDGDGSGSDSRITQPSIPMERQARWWTPAG